MLGARLQDQNLQGELEVACFAGAIFSPKMGKLDIHDLCRNDAAILGRSNVFMRNILCS